MAELKLQEKIVPSHIDEFYLTHKDLWRPTLTALKALGGSGSNQEIYDKVIESEGISETQQNVTIPSGQNKLANRLGWARSYMKAIGAISHSGTGTWALTQ